MSSSLVTLKDVRRQLGSFELKVPEWSVESGSVVGVVGPNGVGKTTLLRLLAGLDAAQSGIVSVLGMDPVAQHTEVRSRCAFMCDDQPVFDVPISRLMGLLSGYYPSWDAERVGQLLERFDLDPKKYAGDLSKGQGTRLRLVIAMAFRPSLLILDEPGIGLDLAGRRSLLESVIEIAGTGESSVIISSHQLGDVERICDRLLVLNEGQVLREGTTDELVKDGQTLEEAMFEWGAA